MYREVIDVRFASLLANYENLVVLDTETSGLKFRSDEIIELAAARISAGSVVEQYDRLIRLSPGRRLDPKITQLTGITEQDLMTNGISKETA